MNHCNIIKVYSKWDPRNAFVPKEPQRPLSVPSVKEASDHY